MSGSIYSSTDKIRYSTDNIRCPSAILGYSIKKKNRGMDELFQGVKIRNIPGVVELQLLIS